MFKYFCCKRHGSISIMLSFLLISVLAFSSTMMETARYRSMQRLLNELEQNAAFSLLGYYDRDLYQQFGLLAIDKNAGQAELKRYLEKNLNALATGMELNGLDKMLEIDKIDVDKLYNLSQNEVLRAQIMEFSAYRAPITLAGNLTNIDETLKKLMEDIQEALPFYETLSKCANLYWRISETVKKTLEAMECAHRCDVSIAAYKTAIGNFNETVSNRNDYRDNDENKKDEYYARNLAEKNTHVKNEAQALREHIKDVKRDVAAFYDKLIDLKKAFYQLGKAQIDTEALKFPNGFGSLKDSVKNAYNTGYDIFATAGGILGDGVPISDAAIEKAFNDSQNALQEQYGRLGGNAENLGTTEAVDTSGVLWVLVQILISQAHIDQMLKIFTDLDKFLVSISDGIKFIKMAVKLGTYEAAYNNVISDSVWNSLPAAPNYGGRLEGISNPYGLEDEKLVADMLEKSKDVADSLDYDTNLLEPDAGPPEETKLEKQMRTTVLKFGEFLDQLGELKLTVSPLDFVPPFSLIKPIQNLVIFGLAVWKLIQFLGALIILMVYFIAYIEDTLRLIYQRTWSAVYANEMFSNRTTERFDRRTMNNEYFPNHYNEVGYMSSVDTECFDMANTEYILSGGKDEVSNQKRAFWMIWMVRMLCNAPAMLANEELKKSVEGLCAGGILGIIVAVIFIIVVYILEAWCDMIFMIYDKKEGVPCIKLEGYFSANGFDDMLKRAKNVVGSTPKLSGWLDEKIEERKKPEGTEKKNEKKLFHWDYKDHMQIMLLLFVSTETLNARCADLIEMQMRQIKGTQEFRLKDMATYVRVQVDAKYRPVLPVPTIPGLNSDGIKMRAMHYSGY